MFWTWSCITPVCQHGLVVHRSLAAVLACCLGLQLGPVVAQETPAEKETPVESSDQTEEGTAQTSTDEKATDNDAAKNADAERDAAKSESELLKKYADCWGPLKRDDGFVSLSKDDAIWIHKKKRAVIVGGQICLRRGALEMFACPRRTKEHESIVAAASKSRFVHAALLAMGAKVGKPVQFQPEYQPASGTVIDVYVLWKDDQGKTRAARAQQWIRDWKTKKAMQQDWVFAGSEFWVDQTSGEKRYSADSGEMVCLSNFSTAMLDIPVESTQSDGALLFEAFTERIPPLRSEVRMVLVPRIPVESEKSKEAEGAQDKATSDDQDS